MAKAPSPSYSKARPPYRGGEYEQPTHEIGGDILTPPGADAKPFELVGGNKIVTTDQTNSLVNRWKVDFVETEAVNVDLTMVAKEATITKINPVLKGIIIDEIEFAWTINKAISAQTLLNTGILVPPALLPADRVFEYTGKAISSDITFTLYAEDGLGSNDSDAVSILFGNNMLLGYGINRSGTSAAALVSAAASMTKVVKTSRIHSYFASGGPNEHHYVLYPKSYGLGIFTKGIFTGGYIRLRSVGGTLKTELTGGDVEVDIVIANEEGFSEAYYAYMSVYDNQVDLVTPFIIS